MFGVDITDHYVVYDHDKQCRDAGSLYHAIDVELYGKKARKVRMSGCWYPEFLFQSTAVSVHYTQRGNYLHFRLTDYGVKNVRGVFCQVLHKGAPINNKEYYQTILYDANDSFSLYTHINEEIMTESISLCITGVKYWNNDQIIESTSYPQKITAKQKKINQSIRSARDQHTALPIEKTTDNVAKSTRKLPFVEEYIETAWIWYPELSELFTWVSSQCDLLEKEISALPQSIMGIDCSAPNENDKVIFIPIECTFNQKFYARLFLAQNHTVEGRIVSPLDMLQYQIPIRAENEPLLLCLYGTHWLDPLILSPGDAIGDDKCKNTYSDIETNSPILRIIGEIKDRVSHRYSERTVQSSNVMRRFYRSIEALRIWIKERYTEVSSLSQEVRPSLWTSEYRLYQYIKLLCSDAIYQYRSNWLDTQSLDMHSVPNKTTEDTRLGMTFNVWSINKLLGTGDKSAWRDVVDEQERKMNQETADRNAAFMHDLKRIAPDEYRKLRTQDQQIAAVQKAREQYDTDKDLSGYIDFWEMVWANGGLKFEGAGWHFELPDLYIKVKRYDDALAFVKRLNRHMHIKLILTLKKSRK